MISSSPPESLLLSIVQASRLIGIPVSTLATWTWRGTHNIPVVRIGRRRYFRRSDLERWIDKHTVVPKLIDLPSRRKSRYSAAEGRRTEAGKVGGT